MDKNSNVSPKEDIYGRTCWITFKLKGDIYMDFGFWLQSHSATKIKYNLKIEFAERKQN